MKYCKIILPFLLAILVYGCSEKDKFESRGYKVSTNADSILNVRDGNFNIALYHPSTEQKEINTFLIPLRDTSNRLFFDVNNKTGEVVYANMKNGELEGKLLHFDSYGVVTDISWYHKGELFLKVTPNGGKVFEDIGKITSDQILKPKVIVSKLTDSIYHFIVEQNTYPIVWSEVILRNHHTMTDFKSNFISNTREFYVKADSTPFSISIDYGIGDSYKPGDRKIVKSFLWNSATDSVEEVKVR